MSAVDFVDDAFWSLLVSDARTWGVDPRVLAQVMMSESGLDPEAVNPAQREANGRPVGGRPNLPAAPLERSCIGLNQLCMAVSENRALIGDVEPADYQKLPASEQWKAGARKYFDGVLRRNPSARSAVDVYWLNYKPGTFHTNAPGDFEIGTDAGNPLWSPDHQGDHMVTPAGIAAFVNRPDVVGTSRWKAVLAAIDAAERGAPMANVTPVAPSKPVVPPVPRVPTMGAPSSPGPFLLFAFVGFLGLRALRRR